VHEPLLPATDPAMSLYQLQKFLYDINRDPGAQQQYHADLQGLLARYELTSEERAALAAGDVGLIYVLGANGQLLMHYAAFLGMSWPLYIQTLRDGVAKHGPVRAGVYAMTTQMDEKVAGV
jgi:Aromatic-ring-opening dioxygenase LigAB, LigA subunit